MKRVFALSLCLFCVLLLFTGCQSVELDSPEESSAVWVFDWDQLESRIIDLTNQALLEKNSSALYRLKSQVVKIHTGENDLRASSRDYWTAFLNVNLVHFEQEHGESTQIQRLIDESIELLENTDYAIAEKNAVLAILYRTKIDYDDNQKFELFSKMQDALDLAIAAEPTNLRVLLAQIFIDAVPVLGFSIDLDAQASIDTALTSTAETVSDAMTPTWGLPKIYEFAIRRLMVHERVIEASELTAQAIRYFPNDYGLKYFAELFQIEFETANP